MTVVNGTVLVSRVNESSNAASFVKLDSNGNKLVEQNYYSGLCGTPKIIVMNNKTYVSTRSSSNELYLYAVDESNNTFTPVIEKQLAKSYGLATDGKNLYIATGTDKGIQMIIYDGSTVQVKPEVAMDNYEPEIAFTQGNVYVVASSKTTDRTLGVYEYNVANNTYTLEGTSVGKSLSGYTLSSSNENLYISFEENSKVVVKKKISSNELLSLTITPPNKISYIQGESVDTTGLVVTANYRKDTRVLNSGDYAISGFDTSVAGERVATISFGGKTNTFTYVVAKKLPEYPNNSIQDGLQKVDGKWYYYEGGKVNTNFSGLIKKDGAWFYIEKGVVNFGYTGLVKKDGAWFYIEKGVLNWNYNGKINYNGKNYTVKNGIAII